MTVLWSDFSWTKMCHVTNFCQLQHAAPLHAPTCICISLVENTYQGTKIGKAGNSHMLIFWDSAINRTLKSVRHRWQIERTQHSISVRPWKWLEANGQQQGRKGTVLKVEAPPQRLLPWTQRAYRLHCTLTNSNAELRNITNRTNAKYSDEFTPANISVSKLLNNTLNRNTHKLTLQSQFLKNCNHLLKNSAHSKPSPLKLRCNIDYRT